MAGAAYNAGPGNVSKWITAHGDPRLPGIDMIEWIEKIPIYETRNYVQRVLENAVIYDVLNPAQASMRAGVRRLSAYLGRARGATASPPAERCAVPVTQVQNPAATAQCSSGGRRVDLRFVTKRSFRCAC